MEVWRDGASSVVLWLHVWGPWWGEHPGTQVLQLHKKIVLQVPISGHWLVLLGAGEKLLCFTKTLFTSIVCLVSCALDFIWKHQIRGQAVLLPRLNAAVLHGGSVFGYWPSTGQLLLGSLRKQPDPWKTLRSCSCSHAYWPQPCGSSGPASKKACFWIISGAVHDSFCLWNPIQCGIWPF